MAKSADAFRTISEVSDWLGTPAHVLRFWESKFTQVKPVKRAGGRRYYRPNDMLLLGGLKKLLHEDGLTIKDAQQYVRTHGVKHVAGLSQDLSEKSASADSAGDVKQSIARVTDAPKPVAAPVVDLFANEDSSPTQSDLFATPPAVTQPAPTPEPAETDEAPHKPEIGAEAAETEQPDSKIDYAALKLALQNADNPDVAALKSVYIRLQSLHERMSTAAQDNNEN